MSDVQEHVRQVMSQPTKELRRLALERVPYHQRAKVEAQVRYQWDKQRKKK